jgi:ABC-2 type transport system permease protein
LNLLAIVGFGSAFTAQALAWGILYPQFESENAAQIPTSLGGLLFMLGAIATLGLVTIAQVWSLRGFLISGLPGRELRPLLSTELWMGAGLTALLCVAATVIPYRLAAARLSRIGRWSAGS